MIRMKPLLTENTNAKTLYKIILNQTGYSDYYDGESTDVSIDGKRSSFGPIEKFVTKLMYGKKRANKEAGDPAKVAELILMQLKAVQELGEKVVTAYYMQLKAAQEFGEKEKYEFDVVTAYYNQLNNMFIENWHGFKLPDYLDNVYQGKPRARKAFSELGSWVNSNTKDTWGLKYPYSDKWYQRLAHTMKKSSTPTTGTPSSNSNMLDTSGSE